MFSKGSHRSCTCSSRVSFTAVTLSLAYLPVDMVLLKTPDPNVALVFVWICLNLLRSNANLSGRPSSSFLSIKLVNQITEKSLVIRLKCELPVPGATVQTCNLVENRQSQLHSESGSVGSSKKVVAASVNSTRRCFTDITLGPTFGAADYECEILYQPSSSGLLAPCANKTLNGPGQTQNGTGPLNTITESSCQPFNWRLARRLSRSQRIMLSNETGTNCTVHPPLT